MKEEEIKDLKYLFEECKDIMEDGYATIKLSLVKKLFDYYNHYNRKDAKRKREFENLQSQLKAKEEVIKEAREKLEEADYETYSRSNYIKLIWFVENEILSKEENKWKV